jgi:hypothetical protein
LMSAASLKAASFLIQKIPTRTTNFAFRNKKPQPTTSHHS